MRPGWAVELLRWSGGERPHVLNRELATILICCFRADRNPAKVGVEGSNPFRPLQSARNEILSADFGTSKNANCHVRNRNDTVNRSPNAVLSPKLGAWPVYSTSFFVRYFRRVASLTNRKVGIPFACCSRGRGLETPDPTPSRCGVAHRFCCRGAHWPFSRPWLAGPVSTTTWCADRPLGPPHQMFPHRSNLFQTPGPLRSASHTINPKLYPATWGRSRSPRRRHCVSTNRSKPAAISFVLAACHRRRDLESAASLPMKQQSSSDGQKCNQGRCPRWLVTVHCLELPS